MGDNTSQLITQILALPTQIRRTRTRIPFEAMHETCLGDVVLHLQMECRIYKRNNLVSSFLHDPSLQLAQYSRRRVLTLGLNASLL